MKIIYVLFAASALAPLAGLASPPRNFDALLASNASRELPSPLRPFARRVTVAHDEPRLGVPTFVWGVQADPESSPLLRNLDGLRPDQAARRYLLELAELYRLREEDVAEARVRAVHDTGSGGIVVSFAQQAEGLELFRTELSVLMTRRLELVAISGHLSSEALAHKDYGQRFLLSAQTAASVAFEDLTGAAVDARSFQDQGAGEAGYHRYTLTEFATRTMTVVPLIPLRTKAVLFELPEGLEPGFYVELNTGNPRESGSEYFAYVVSAIDGRVLFRNNLTHRAYSYRVWADPVSLVPYHGPQGANGTPHPTGTPDGYQAPFVPASLLTLEHAGLSTNDPWLSSGATVTTGNNVDAYDDLAGPDGFSQGDVRATATAPGVFDYPYDLSLAPGATHTQHQASVVELFYLTNFFHDWYYDLGFNEQAGNAQQSNFGRGGVGNDVLLAEGQDYSGLDNADMQVPADGASPRMQMYIFSGKGTLKLTVLSPQAVAGDKAFGSAEFGPASFDLTAELALANDGTAPTTDACQPLPSGSMTGKIALIDRGSCTFAEKVAAAQAAGALGAIIANNTGTSPMPLLGSAPAISIPSQSVSLATGTALASQLNGGQTVSVHMLSTAGVSRDGALDNDIVAHEWGHYISNRLIGNANGLSNNQGGEMGEGWGDFHSLLMGVRETDALVAANPNWSGVFGLATYTSSGGGNEGYYFGIRRVPYSTDFSKNALTFKHIQDGVALPTTAPVAFGADGASNSEVHAAGEVWATMLWECYAALLRSGRFAFSQAQQRMKSYLVASYKMTPSSPTFLEARDALLAVAFAADFDDFTAFAQAFARRGAGVGAVAADRGSTNNSGLVESFASGGDLSFVSASIDDSVSSCDQDGVLDNTETGLFTITLKNTGTAALSSTTATISTPVANVSFSDGGKIAFPASQPFATVTASLQVSLSGLQGSQRVPITITFSDPGLAVPRDLIATFTPRVNYELAPLASKIDDVESPVTHWLVGHDSRLGGSASFRRVEEPAGAHWFGPNATGAEDQYLVSPELQVATSGSFVIQFRHRYRFETDRGEAFDGAVIELRKRGGSWVDIGTQAVPGYNVTLYDGTQYGNQFIPSSNPLHGRRAFGGGSPGYPEYLTTTIDLGTEYADSFVQVRFRIGSDEAAGATGWDIDDIGFSGITNTPFDRVVPGHATCGNQPPTANAGEAFSVDEGAQATLLAVATDPDADALSFHWVQTTGPTVALGNADTASPSFTAPLVNEDQTLAFELTVSDGLVTTSPSSVQVLVRNVNQRPVAVAGADQTVDEGAAVVLSGAGSSDPDGNSVSFTWTQVSGPGVELSGANTEAPSFTAPTVSQNTELVFSLVVSDGVAQSQPALVKISVLDKSTEREAPHGGGCGCGVTDSRSSMLLLAGLVALARARRRNRGRLHS